MGSIFFFLEIRSQEGYQVVGRLVGTHRERGGGWLQVLTRHDMVVVCVWVCVCMYVPKVLEGTTGQCVGV